GKDSAGIFKRERAVGGEREQFLGAEQADGFAQQFDTLTEAINRQRLAVQRTFLNSQNNPAQRRWQVTLDTVRRRTADTHERATADDERQPRLGIERSSVRRKIERHHWRRSIGVERKRNVVRRQRRMGERTSAQQQRHLRRDFDEFPHFPPPVFWWLRGPCTSQIGLVN